MKNLIKQYSKIIDILLVPFVYLSAVVMYSVRRTGVHRLPLSKKVLLKRGVFPITNHYYEPLFETEGVRDKLKKERDLPGIDLNDEGQLRLLEAFSSENELKSLTNVKKDDLKFAFDNTTLNLEMRSIGIILYV